MAGPTLEVGRAGLHQLQVILICRGKNQGTIRQASTRQHGEQHTHWRSVWSPCSSQGKFPVSTWGRH